MRIHPKWTGEVRLFGQPLESYSQRQLARRISYVPQAGNDQRFPYTVQEFVRMGRYPYSSFFGSADPGDNRAISSAMSRAGVEMFADRTLSTLSGGERQKVFIAATLAQETEIFLLDEPTAFLDYRHQREVSRVLKTMSRKSDATILTVTHDVNTAILTGGHILALRHGEVAWSGLTEDLISEQILSDIFDAEFRFIDDPVTGLRLLAPQEAKE
jgi:iron complex transport system ATP-binding protein